MKLSQIISVLLLLGAGCSTTPTKQTHTLISKKTIHHSRFVPKYDFAGHWNSDNSAEHSDACRRGRHIVETYNTADYEHVVEGNYIDDQTIEGIQTRRKRSDGTTTRMRVTIVLLSSDLSKTDWIVLDSNSDLSKGQTGTSINRRVILPQP